MTDKFIISDPTMQRVLELFKQDIFSSLNCHAIGKIESFDSSTQTARVTIDYSRSSSLDNDASVKPKSYPVLSDIPVIVLGGGNGSLRFPIAKNDGCIVLFNDRDIDNWYGGGTTYTLLNTDRKHSLADGIAIVGLRSLSTQISDYDADRTELKHNETVVSLSDKIKIENAVKNLYTVLDAVFAILEGFTSTPAVLGAPVTLSVAQVALMTAARADLALLLE